MPLTLPVLFQRMRCLTGGSPICALISGVGSWPANTLRLLSRALYRRCLAVAGKAGHGYGLWGAAVTVYNGVCNELSGNLVILIKSRGCHA